MVRNIRRATLKGRINSRHCIGDRKRGSLGRSQSVRLTRGIQRRKGGWSCRAGNEIVACNPAMTGKPGGRSVMPDRIRLDGRVAVVTGAAGVIGTATIRLLAERGARIVAVDRDESRLQAAIKELPSAAQALALTADVTQEDEVAAYVRAATEKFGAIDVFYNNAGIEGEITPIVRYPLETFRRVLEVNVVGVFLGLKHVLPVMLQQDRGSIINTASIEIGRA